MKIIRSVWYIVTFMWSFCWVEFSMLSFPVGFSFYIEPYINLPHEFLDIHEVFLFMKCFCSVFNLIYVVHLGVNEPCDEN